MTGEVIEFPGPDSKKRRRKSGKEQQVAMTHLKTNHDIFSEVTEDVLGEWQRYAVQNRLSEYVSGKLPARVRGPVLSDYVNNLNLLSETEQKLGMKVAIFYPGCTLNNTYGWLVAFHRGKEIFSTPPDMATEAIARALNIVLYVSFIETLHTLGRQ